MNRVEYTQLFQHKNRVKPRFVDKEPSYYESCSKLYQFEYVVHDELAEIHDGQKCIGLTEMSNDASRTLINLFKNDETTAWNILYFTITRNADATLFKGRLCLYRQSTDNLIDETIDDLRALKGEQPRVLENYLKKATRSFL